MTVGGSEPPHEEMSEIERLTEQMASFGLDTTLIAQLSKRPITRGFRPSNRSARAHERERRNKKNIDTFSAPSNYAHKLTEYAEDPGDNGEHIRQFPKLGKVLPFSPKQFEDSETGKVNAISRASRRVRSRVDRLDGDSIQRRLRNIKSFEDPDYNFAVILLAFENGVSGDITETIKLLYDTILYVTVNNKKDGGHPVNNSDLSVQPVDLIAGLLSKMLQSNSLASDYGAIVRCFSELLVFHTISIKYILECDIIKRLRNLLKSNPPMDLKASSIMLLMVLALKTPRVIVDYQLITPFLDKLYDIEGTLGCVFIEATEAAVDACGKDDYNFINNLHSQSKTLGQNFRTVNVRIGMWGLVNNFDAYKYLFQEEQFKQILMYVNNEDRPPRLHDPTNVMKRFSIKALLTLCTDFPEKVYNQFEVLKFIKQIYVDEKDTGEPEESLASFAYLGIQPLLPSAHLVPEYLEILKAGDYERKPMGSNRVPPIRQFTSIDHKDELLDTVFPVIKKVMNHPQEEIQDNMSLALMNVIVATRDTASFGEKVINHDILNFIMDNFIQSHGLPTRIYYVSICLAELVKVPELCAQLRATDFLRNLTNLCMGFHNNGTNNFREYANHKEPSYQCVKLLLEIKMSMNRISSKPAEH